MFNWFRKLLGLLHLADIVWTEDYDAVIRMRTVQCSPFGRYTVAGSVPGRRVVLNPDGTASSKGGWSDAVRWKPYRVRQSFSEWMRLDPEKVLTTDEVKQRAPEIVDAIVDQLQANLRKNS